MISININDVKKSKQFTNVFQLLMNISYETNMYLRKDELFIQGMDSAQICIYELKISKEWFTNYNIDEERTIGVNLRLIYKVLNCRGTNQEITIVYDFDKSPDVLEFQFENGSKEETNKYLTIPLYEFDVSLLDLTMDDYQADIKMYSSQLHNLIEQMSLFGEIIRFECNEEYLQMEGGDNSTGNIRVPIKIEDLISYMIEEEGHLKMSFSAKYIKNITMFSKIFKEVYIHLDSEKPMNFYYNFDEEITENNEENNINYLKIYLAPKMFDDQDNEY